MEQHCEYNYIFPALSTGKSRKEEETITYFWVEDTLPAMHGEVKNKRPLSLIQIKSCHLDALWEISPEIFQTSWWMKEWHAMKLSGQYGQWYGKCSLEKHHFTSFVLFVFIEMIAKLILIVGHRLRFGSTVRMSVNAFVLGQFLILDTTFKIVHGKKTRIFSPQIFSGSTILAPRDDLRWSHFSLLIGVTPMLSTPEVWVPSGLWKVFSFGVCCFHQIGKRLLWHECCIRNVQSRKPCTHTEQSRKEQIFIRCVSAVQNSVLPCLLASRFLFWNWPHWKSAWASVCVCVLSLKKIAHQQAGQLFTAPRRTVTRRSPRSSCRWTTTATRPTTTT